LKSVFQDSRFAPRIVSKAPLFGIVAVVTPAVGIGATTAIFSVADALLLRPLSYRDPDRLLLIAR
jgi:putative ABC transport system permease protein